VIAVSSLLFLLVPTLLRQAPAGHQSQLGAEFALQSTRIAGACHAQLSSLFKCPVEFVTDHPLHLAVGSLAPQNGFAVGPAFVTHRYSDAHDLSWNADAVRAPGGSWRAGVYFKAVLTPVAETVVVPIETSAAETPADLVIHPYPIIDAYAQTMSLGTVFFYGLGPDTRKADQSAFGMQETVVGTHVIYPLAGTRAFRALNLSVTGEVNGRFIDLKDADRSKKVPSLAALYDEQTAPGMSAQPAFVQFGEGVRIKPGLLGQRLHFNEALSFAQFVAPSDSHYSFRRWTVDLDQEFSIYRTVMTDASRDTHGPDDCSATLGDAPCPPPSVSHNRYGSVGFHLYASDAMAGAGSAVPFYFQQTLGGSDIDGNRSLSAYDDYRFRGSKVFVLRESFEHYLYGVVGVALAAAQGTVAAPGAPSRLGNLKRTTEAGLSFRAGGLPMAYVTWGWGPEGHRLIAVVNTSLLGGGSRPKLN
jgi:hypothetical protein